MQEGGIRARVKIRVPFGEGARIELNGGMVVGNGQDGVFYRPASYEGIDPENDGGKAYHPTYDFIAGAGDGEAFKREVNDAVIAAYDRWRSYQ